MTHIMAKKNQSLKYPPLRFPGFTDEWKEVRLGEVADYVQKRGRCRLYLSTENMLPDFQGIQECLLEQATSGILFQAGDVLVSNIRPYLRKAWLANKAGCCSADVLVFRHKSLLDPMFFYYIMANQKFIDYMMRAAKGVKMPRGDKGHVIQYPLRLPSLPEQRKIAALLSAIDERIETQSAVIKDQEALKAALLRRLFDRTLRFPGFTDEWKEVKLGEVTCERNETNAPTLPLLSITVDKGIIPQTDSEKKDVSNADKSKYKRICSGDIGYNTMRMWQGRSALSFVEGIVSPAYTIVTPQKGVSPLFLSYLIKRPRMIYEFWTHSQGLVEDTLNCKYKDFSQITIAIPSLPEQRKIAALLSAIDERLAVEREYAEQLKLQKAYLLREMFI